MGHVANVENHTFEEMATVCVSPVSSTHEYGIMQLCMDSWDGVVLHIAFIYISSI